METDAIATVRAFNRLVGERIGALSDQFPGRGRPMGESRTLWEIGEKGAEIRELRARLGLDSGYLSRILSSLERQALVTVAPSQDDGRVRVARLTRKGRAEKRVLDRRSEQVALGFLRPLNDVQRSRLLDAMREIERLLVVSMIEIRLERPTSADARWCLSQYFAELSERFESGFDPGRSISADAAELTPPAGMLLVARLHGRPVGCGALKLHGRAPAELKRMWVAPDARGLGLGARILGELEDHARRSGALTVRLETNRALAEAVQLYRTRGYREVAPFNDELYAHHWFEKQLG